MNHKSTEGLDPYVVGDQIDTRDLLEHLVDVGKGHTVELAVLGHVEETGVGALGHFQDGELDGFELVLDEGIVAVFLVKGLEDFDRLVVHTLHHQPTGRLGQVQNGAEDDEGEDDLEGQGEAPADFVLSDPRHTCGALVSVLSNASSLGLTVVNPVTDGNSGGDQHALNHDQLSTGVGLGGLRLPGGWIRVSMSSRYLQEKSSQTYGRWMCSFRCPSR